MPANWLVLLFIGSSRSRLVTRGRNSLRSRWRLCRLTDAASPLKSPDIQKETPAYWLVFLFVLSAKYRCRTRPGPRTAGRRFCAVQAFCRRQNLSVGAIHLPRAFEISQDSIKITTPNGVVIFMSCVDKKDAPENPCGATVSGIHDFSFCFFHIFGDAI